MLVCKTLEQKDGVLSFSHDFTSVKQNAKDFQLVELSVSKGMSINCMRSAPLTFCSFPHINNFQFNCPAILREIVILVD